MATQDFQRAAPGRFCATCLQPRHFLIRVITAYSGFEDFYMCSPGSKIRQQGIMRVPLLVGLLRFHASSIHLSFIRELNFVLETSSNDVMILICNSYFSLP